MAEVLLSSDPTLFPPSHYKPIIMSYFLEKHSENIIELLRKECGPQEHCSLRIKFSELLDHDPPFAYFVLNYPLLMLPLLDGGLLEIQRQILRHPSFEKNHGKGYVKQHCHARLTHLPPIFRYSKPTINDINTISDEATSNSLIQFCGTILRVSGIKMLEVSKQYECQNPKCKYRFTVFADPEQGNMLPQPRTCPSRSQEEGAKPCNSSNLREIEGSRICVDYQEIKVQDKIEHLQFGSIPRTIVVTVQADLVDSFRPGDDVIIVGTIIRQWKPVIKSARISIDIAVRAHSIRDMNGNDSLKVMANNYKPLFNSFWDAYKNNLFEGRNFIVRSICPQLYGMFYVKLCLLLTLIGGSIPPSQQLKSSTGDNTKFSTVKRRYQSHLLLVGDPGCGKSQLLRFAASVSKRSIITTGIGTTGAGLTCSMVKDGADWEVEAGAMVLANDGVCCIDEFASVREQDRATIHEAMEQQTLSIAKAGVVLKLNTRATVIACCNPKGSYDVSLDISTNTAIASPLLSRFDLVLILLDVPNKDWDKKVSTFLLQRAVGTNQISNKIDSSGETWDIPTLTQYISYVRTSYHPVINPEAKALLLRYYQMQRQSDDRSSSRTTVRLLESLLRLSEAHAKLMRRSEVILCDAVVSVKCIALSQTRSSILESNATLQSDFPDNCEEFYFEEERKVFELLAITKERFLESVYNQNKSDTVEEMIGEASSQSEQNMIVSSIDVPNSANHDILSSLSSFDRKSDRTFGNGKYTANLRLESNFHVRDSLNNGEERSMSYPNRSSQFTEHSSTQTRVANSAKLTLDQHAHESELESQWLQNKNDSASKESIEIKKRSLEANEELLDYNPRKHIRIHELLENEDW